jgi:hypothetical protein
MNIQELSQRLYEAGCNQSQYAIGKRGSASDAFCLTHKGTEWQVYYTERGRDSAPIYASSEEASACEFFFDTVMAMRHDHCVGFFKSEANADALCQQLALADIAAWRDAIPFGGLADSRYRVFVTGKALFLARALLGIIPASDVET